MKCKICSLGLPNALFSVKENGVVVGWYCREHYPKEIDPLVDDIVATIEEYNDQDR